MGPFKIYSNFKIYSTNYGVYYCLSTRNYLSIHIDLLRVVYGGDYTILLDKNTGERICKVKREKAERNNLTKAILYLLLKSQDVYGTEIEKYLENDCCNYIGLMRYLLEYGERQSYTQKDVMEYHEMIEREVDPEVGFMYVMLLDRFDVKPEQIDILIKEAVCTETDKTRLRLAKKRKIKKHNRAKKTAKSREELEKL